MAGPDGIGTEPLTDRLQQDHLQRAAVDRVLRPTEAGRPTARILHDLLTILAQVFERARLDAVRRQRLAEPQLDEFARPVGQQVDADAERPISVADSKTSGSMPRACSLSAAVRPPIPAPITRARIALSCVVHIDAVAPSAVQT